MTPERPTHRIEVETEVPGTPEQVWDAIATGPGISSWFMPTALEAREGGVVSMDMGDGAMTPAGVVTAWEPPERVAVSEEWPTESGSAGRLATEYLVEARSGGSCIVRIVVSGFGGDDNWDEQFESMREGWIMFLRNLRLYLEGFAGQTAALISVSGSATGPHDKAHAALLERLGLTDISEGAVALAQGPGVPPLRGTVHWTFTSPRHEVLQLRTEEPAPGMGLVLVNVWQGDVHVNVVLYLFGEAAEAAADRDRPRWRAWMDEHFPSQAEPAA